ncbi:MAG: hypothetical protein OEV99_10595 [Nitrospira sp.]|nr:hypothetical protein [Nitrospira sp.]MDH4370283.1 hypothetical protein [Nitrospira sp.]MDH5346916.1 hypothetical protein [Nitrospira sp.]
MVMGVFDQMRWIRCGLCGVFLAGSWGSVVPIASAADSTQPVYDWERPIGKQGDRKSPRPARKPLNPVPSPSERPRWKKPAPQPQNDLEIDTLREAQSPQSTESPRVPKGGVVANEGVSSAGPMVVGRVMYRGPVPAPIQVQVDRDTEVCGQVATITRLSVDPATHGVRDAIVHIGLGQEAVGDSPVQVSVVQNRHCAFSPRVAALRAGGATEISNADPVMHNTNMTLNSRTVVNVAVVAGGNPIRKPLKKEGLHLIKCNVHKFMQAYRYVFTDPFFDETNETGQFQIAGLPPGLHAVSVWHETLGVLHKEIQVPVRGTVTIEFEFK